VITTGLRGTASRFLFGGRREIALIRIGLLTAVIGFVDMRLFAITPLGILYLIPMLLASRVLSRVQIIALAGFYTFLSEFGANYSYHRAFTSTVLRDGLNFAAFCGIGLLGFEVMMRLRTTAAHLLEQKRAAAERRGIEEQLENLIESSPIAIFTADGEGNIQLGNEAAHRLFNMKSTGVAGSPITRYLPSLSTVLSVTGSKQAFRTVMQCKGYRDDNTVFLADVWFSTYLTSVGPRLAAMIVDTSEEFRDRETAGLHHLLSGSRILVGALFHEIRNVCGAISVVHQNLGSLAAVKDNPDFEALGTLVVALEKIASLELRQTTDSSTRLDLRNFLEELMIVVEPASSDLKIEVVWESSEAPIFVWADRQSLMQVFLNLVKNSESAMEESSEPSLTFEVTAAPQRVLIAVIDNGPGVAQPELLFRPFQENAQTTGLGLYLSRALARSFRGELRYEPSDEGAIFIVELSRALLEAGREEGDHA
jgi:two-component system, LuxR family, sensor kinase FixL